MHKTQGDLAENVAILYFTSIGYLVSKPVTHSSYYDIIVDNGEKLLKVEVKSSKYEKSNNSYEITLKTSGGNRKSNYISKLPNDVNTDYLFAVIFAKDKTECYLIPSIIVSNKKSI